LGLLFKKGEKKMKHKIPDVSKIFKVSAPYSYVVQQGNILYVSGIPGMDYEKGELAGTDFESQARKSFENISNLLIECGSGMDKVVKTTVLLCDAKNFGKLNDLYTEFFPTNPPARSTPIVGLPLDTLHISIDCIAYIA
jgi:2-iminobutanoate/2-iminopropanoate deaminase